MFRIVLACVVIGVSCCGCGSSSGPPRRAIHGKINSSRPVQILTLQPIDGLAAPAVTTLVVDGQYKFQRSDGPLPGNYRVVPTFADETGGLGQPKKEISLPPAVRPQHKPTPPPNIEVLSEGPLELDVVIP
ncbi:hypothetical protein [Anatilimnocola floriformis]|uniref:hypothetical protein n=1 Tax=Anatilimnocola floriformis TaxID=2948575 RepID=UPI0020C26BEC|nr:hypothetical protein [Anatilimnocola floriformis]